MSEFDITLDARTFARAWKSCALASGKDKERPVLDRTVAIESYPSGVRLIATDGYILLHSWVGLEGAKEPARKSKPKVTVVARDLHGRAVGLASHIINITAEEDAPILDLRLVLGLDDEDEPGTFSGLDRTVVTLEIPDQERLKLPIVESPYPDWRQLLSGFTPVTTDAIALHAERLERIAKLGKIHAERPIRWKFGGEDRMALLDVVDAEPSVSGCVMPLRMSDG